MRFVDPHFVEGAAPVDMITASLDLSRRLSELEDSSGSDEMEREAQKLWSAMKPHLAGVMNRKCWYCETRQDRADNAVDHFRPKSVYWWLAGDYTNFRFACTFCNSRRKDYEGTSGGKADEFPLVDENARAASPTDQWEHECPMLLDPCKHQDPQYLWYDETGLPRLNPAMSSWPAAGERVKESVRLLHLDQGNLARRRRRKHLDVVVHCREGDRLYATFETTGDPDVLARWSEKVVDVRRLIDSKSEYSAAARCAALGLPKSKTATEALASM